MWHVRVVRVSGGAVQNGWTDRDAVRRVDSRGTLNYNGGFDPPREGALLRGDICLPVVKWAYETMQNWEWDGRRRGLQPNYFGHLFFRKWTNKAVIDRRLRSRCCHLGSYFKHTSFSCRCIRRDIMRKHDVRKYSTRRLRPSRLWLQKVVPIVGCLQHVFLRAKPKAACELHCLGLAATSNSQLAYVQIWRHPQNRKYATYHYAVRAGPSHGHR